MLRLWIQERAAAMGISMMKLSHRSEVSYSLLRDLFADPYHPVTLRTLERIACALEVPATSLLVEAAEKDQDWLEVSLHLMSNTLIHVAIFKRE